MKKAHKDKYDSMSAASAYRYPCDTVDEARALQTEIAGIVGGKQWGAPNTTSQVVRNGTLVRVLVTTTIPGEND